MVFTRYGHRQNSSQPKGRIPFTRYRSYFPVAWGEGTDIWRKEKSQSAVGQLIFSSPPLDPYGFAGAITTFEHFMRPSSNADPVLGRRWTAAELGAEKSSRLVQPSHFLLAGDVRLSVHYHPPTSRYRGPIVGDRHAPARAILTTTSRPD